ncbi:hypothetical protein QBC39DRAFT_139963 [Podospora conica]|nr:hypothetical protein QBC39DRAFT_139963 [Schizothecium conicum]
MCATEIHYACATTLLSKSITCLCDRVVASGRSTLNCGTCDHARCRELRGEVVGMERHRVKMHRGGAVSTGGR